MTLEELVEEECKKEEYSMYDDREVVCECGNRLLFRIFRNVPANEVSIMNLTYKGPPELIRFEYECLKCGKDHERNWLSRRAYAATKLLSNYDLDKLKDELYLEAIIELEEYLC